MVKHLKLKFEESKHTVEGKQIFESKNEKEPVT